jgi:hypothetical protein
LTAGAAAQWVAFHSRAAIEAEAKLRGVFVQDLFRKAAQSTAQDAPHLDTDDFGPGILDVEALLKRDLAEIPEIKNPIRFDLDDVGDDIPADYREIFERFNKGGVETAAGFDWAAFTGELGYVALDRAMIASSINEPLEATPSVVVSATLAAAARASTSHALKSLTGVTAAP